ncbi:MULTISPECIES: nitroreductase family deazaflavin-dependent oxidoreductase [Streptomycetaceae]|uniref:Deazaflavin-dependent nitroreductase n=1 Tax=Streptantibioticus cattleyicolor (strain ATCC 35852 / DSM 46488 / JCM 4925 / NBRC 14057 / NRRL 8057) TaxID=1003195 RepID=F8JZ48_STREN|nr:MULTISPECIES: nitroreductase family deazaflavin-dependent oxidoreductase [Streptomycetaceae]AEW94714.1 hypothetical protein SCATT_23430 [Streptantibioticus cattleyicolor NRRL 8057 = DSM 46488]MYS59345.1 nitroreductase family deazaflavin-dependent oxidoreductase [Streptomyces sp. SID5468]CCB75070.1 conserved protein of unknown function [Streptantibioticus cattleyicolor NRRL 8057 = DSM 46488]
MTAAERGGTRRNTRQWVQKISSTRGFAAVAPHIVPLLDKTVHRLTRGKVMLSARAMPSLVLTTTGARTGLPRTTPLACMPEAGGTFVVVGSNFGREHHPAWTANLLRHPQARISRRGRETPVTATLLTGPERDRAWQAVVRFWPPYAAYAARVDREIRLFRLVPDDGS